MSPATVLLSLPATSGGGELRRFAVAAGFEVVEHALGTPPAVDFGPVAVAVIDVGESPDAAAAQTRRWRTELDERVVPVMWVAPAGSVAAGLAAGADVVLTRPVEQAVFTAQLRSLARAQSAAARLVLRADEAKLLGEQLRKALAQLDHEQEMARRVRAGFLPRSYPQVGAARFHVCYRPRGRSGGDFHDVRRIDEGHVGFFIGDVVGTGAPGGALLGVYAHQSAVMKHIGEGGYHIVPPGEVLTAVNRQLLALGADDLPLVAMTAGVLNAITGSLSLARAGAPAAVHVPATDPPTAWNVPGSFLGAADTQYQSMSATLAPGDRLLIGTDGIRPDGDPTPADSSALLAAAAKHRGLAWQEFADAVARELLQHVRHADDFTLMCVEMTGG